MTTRWESTGKRFTGSLKNTALARIMAVASCFSILPASLFAARSCWSAGFTPDQAASLKDVPAPLPMALAITGSIPDSGTNLKLNPYC